MTEADRLSPVQVALRVVVGVALVGIGLVLVGATAAQVVLHGGDAAWWGERVDTSWTPTATNASTTIGLGALGLAVLCGGVLVIRSRRPRPLRHRARPDPYAGPR